MDVIVNDSCILDVTIELFGSSASGFALSTSNVNLDLNIPGAQENQVSQKVRQYIAPFTRTSNLYSNPLV